MQILSTIPSKNASNVALNQAITISFDSPIDTATVDESSISVTTNKTSIVSVVNGLPQPGSPFSSDDFFSDGYTALVNGSISVNEDTLIFTPSKKYSTDTTYRVSISSAISDTAGNTLDKIYFFEFTTASEDMEIEELPDVAKDAVTIIGSVVNVGSEQVKEGFYLESTYPRENSFLMIDGKISLEFSEDVDETSLDNIFVYRTDIFSDYPPVLLSNAEDYSITVESNTVKMQLTEVSNIDNSIYTIEIGTKLKSTDENLFSKKYSFSYIGKLTPYYASTKLMKLKAGTVLGSVADINLALSLYYASLEADEKLSRVPFDITTKKLLAEKYALYSALEGSLKNNFSFGLNDFIKKQLGEFSISVSTKSKVDLYNSILQEAKDFKRIFDEYLNTRGSLGYFKKGSGRSDIGRLWDRGRRYPGLNTKVQTDDERWKLIWTPLYQGV